MLLSAFVRISKLTKNSSGELLLDQQRYPDAIEKFERAVEIERSKYVHVTFYLATFNLTTVIGLPQ